MAAASPVTAPEPCGCQPTATYHTCKDLTSAALMAAGYGASEPRGQ